MQKNIKKNKGVKDWPWWKLFTTVRPLIEVQLSEEQIRNKDVRIMWWVPWWGRKEQNPSPAGLVEPSRHPSLVQKVSFEVLTQSAGSLQAQLLQYLC